MAIQGRWVNSHDLRPGDVLLGRDGAQQFVLRVEQEYVSGFAIVNLTIEQDHTFAVGSEGVLVHNSCAQPVKVKPIDATRPQHGTPSHHATSVREAKKMEQAADTVDARFNQQLVDANGNSVPGFRPDAQRIRTDGKVDVREVRSRSQSIPFMNRKQDAMSDALGDQAGVIDWIDAIGN